VSWLHTWQKRGEEMQYTHFPSAFSFILHAPLALIFAYCRQKRGAAKLKGKGKFVPVLN
jgi:hypothetical protein